MNVHVHVHVHPHAQNLTRSGLRQIEMKGAGALPGAEQILRVHAGGCVVCAICRVPCALCELCAVYFVPSAHAS